MNGTAKGSGVSIDSHFAIPGSADRGHVADSVAHNPDSAVVFGLKDIDTLILFADTHVGCPTALCPPDGAKLDDGGIYMPTRFQRKIYAWWAEMWNDWVPLVTRGSKFAAVHVGDAMDGRHHGSVSQYAHNLTDQKNIAYELLAPIVEQAEGRYYHIRGTEAHAGPSAEAEEELAKRLGAIPNAEGQHARYQLLKWLHGEDALVDIMHHIGTTSSAAYESTAVHKEYVTACVEAGRWGERLPDAIVRAHRHRYFKTEVAGENGRAMSIVLPGWQGKTSFLWKTGARQSQPEFGGIMLRVSEEGEFYEREFVRRLSRPEPE